MIDLIVDVVVEVCNCVIMKSYPIKFMFEHDFSWYTAWDVVGCVFPIVVGAQVFSFH